MVHALAKIWGMLGENGRLLDIHPLGEPSTLEIEIGNMHFPAGWINEASDYEKFRRANEAVKEVINKGLFSVVKAKGFEYYAYAKSLDEVNAYLRDNWADAWLDELVTMRAQDLLQTTSTATQLIITEQTQINLLRPLKE